MNNDNNFRASPAASRLPTADQMAHEALKLNNSTSSSSPTDDIDGLMQRVDPDLHLFAGNSMPLIISYAEELRRVALNGFNEQLPQQSRRSARWRARDLTQATELENFLIDMSTEIVYSQVAIPLLMAYLAQANLEVDNRVISSFAALLSSPRTNRE